MKERYSNRRRTRLRAWCEAFGHSREDVARTLGCSIGLLTEIELTQSGVDVLDHDCVERAFGVDRRALIALRRDWDGGQLKQMESAFTAFLEGTC